MEAKAAENSMVISNDQKAIITTPHEEPAINSSLNLKKGKKSNNIFKVALFMMRGRSRKSSKMVAVDKESKNIWRKLVGSMRPLHLQSDNDNDNNNNNIPHQSENGGGNYESDSTSEFTCPQSPSSSRYASAVGLSEMVKEEEEEEKEKEAVMEEDGEGDEMIDAKAEEFIAHFYYQIKLQRLGVIDPDYQEISRRLNHDGRTDMSFQLAKKKLSR